MGKKPSGKTNRITKTKIAPTTTKAAGAEERPVTDELHNLSIAYRELDLKFRVMEQMIKLFYAPKRVKTNLDMVLELCIDVANCETGSIFLVDQEENDLFFATVHGPKAKDLQDLHIAFGQGIAGTSAQDQKSIAVSDVTKDPRFCKKISDSIGFETHSILAVPIIYKGNTLGVIELINKKHSDTFLHNEIKLVERVAEITSILLVIAAQLKKPK